MKNYIVIAAAQDNDRVRRLEEILRGKYLPEVVFGADDAISALDRAKEDTVALIVDCVALFPDARALIGHVKESNTLAGAIPVLLLTDRENIGRDEEYLDNTAVGVILDGERARVIEHRITMAIGAINSVTFSEFSEMLKVLPSLIYLKDAKGRYVFCSQYLHHLDHYDEPGWTIRGKTDLEIRRDRENARKAYESDMKIVETGKGTSYIIEENEDGVQEYLQLIKEPLMDENGKVRGIIAIINNVTEQETLRKELQKKSTTDELTGLFNRYLFDVMTTDIYENVYPLSIISADCDGLKMINDMYGHMVGDEYLRLAATLFKTTLPEGSMLFRTGGDEFIFLLPHTGREELKKCLEKLNSEQQTYKIKDRTLSVSFGAAVVENASESLEKRIEESDAEMYRNKRAKKKT